MARSFKIFGIKDGGSEEWVDTVSSPKAGKAAHEAMKTEGLTITSVAAIAWAALRFEYNLGKNRKEDSITLTKSRSFQHKRRQGRIAFPCAASRQKQMPRKRFFFFVPPCATLECNAPSLIELGFADLMLGDEIQLVA